MELKCNPLISVFSSVHCFYSCKDSSWNISHTIHLFIILFILAPNGRMQLQKKYFLFSKTWNKQRRVQQANRLATYVFKKLQIKKRNKANWLTPNQVKKLRIQ